MSNVYAPFTKSFPIAQVTEATHEVTGICCSEAVDSENEVCSYKDQVDCYREWSDSQLAVTTAAGIGKNKGNIRVQHDPHRVGGRAIDLRYDDASRAIWLTSVPTPDVWPLICDGFLTSYSHAGQYLRRWHKACGTDIPRGNNCPTCGLTNVPVHYFAKLAEVSYCDRGSNPNATFQFVRADGVTAEVRKFRASVDQSDSTGFEPEFFLSYPAEPVTGFEIGESLADRLWNLDDGIVLPTYSDDSTGFE